MTKKIEKKLISLGMVKAGQGYYVTQNSRDVMDGCCIENTPSATYLWYFVLPMFDHRRFMHLTFSRRICWFEKDATPDAIDSAVEKFVNFWRQGERITDLVALSKLADDVTNPYAEYVRYLIAILNTDVDNIEKIERSFGSNGDTYKDMFFFEDYETLSGISGPDAISRKRAVIDGWRRENEAWLAALR